MGEQHPLIKNLLGRKLFDSKTFQVYEIIAFLAFANSTKVNRLYLSNGEDYTAYILNPASGWILLDKVKNYA